VLFTVDMHTADEDVSSDIWISCALILTWPLETSAKCGYAK
jgi:hypothetical protein